MSEGNFERTKLKKQLTQRKRGKEPTPAAADAAPAEEAKSTGPARKSSLGSNTFIGKQWKKYAPTYL